MSRQDRATQDIDDRTRIWLLEGDVDTIDGKLTWTNRFLFSILVTLATGMTFAAAAVVTGAVGG